MDGRVVPTASWADAPRARMAGVEMVAPPTPKAPDSTPVATPAPMVRTSRTGPASISSAGPRYGQLPDVAQGDGGHAGVRRGPQRHLDDDVAGGGVVADR